MALSSVVTRVASTVAHWAAQMAYWMVVLKAALKALTLVVQMER
jgi:hypothetical protein